MGEGLAAVVASRASWSESDCIATAETLVMPADEGTAATKISIIKKMSHHTVFITKLFHENFGTVLGKKIQICPLFNTVIAKKSHYFLYFLKNV